jgi:hypothetical protein
MAGQGFSSNGGGTLRDVWTYDFDTNMWAEICSANELNKDEAPLGVDSTILPWARGRFSLDKLSNGSIAYLYGGADISLNYFGDLWIVDLLRLNSSNVNISVTSTTGNGEEPAIVASSSSTDNSAIVAIAVVIPLFFVLLGIMILAFFLWRRRR